MEIDARKLSCPAPVIMTKQAVEKKHPEKIDVMVDNQAAKQNVSRFLQSQGYAVNAHSENDIFHVTGVRSGTDSQTCEISSEPQPADSKIMVMVATDRFGFGDEELGLKLMVNFIKTLNEMQPELWKLVFVNNGVKLAAAGSKVLPELKELVQKGTDILVCGTCLTHFNLLDKKQVGDTTNMLDIVTAMRLADKVINI
jgi:selenium metabolism protein YedF